MSKNVLEDAATEVMKVVYEEDRRMLTKHLADICEGREKIHNLHSLMKTFGTISLINRSYSFILISFFAS